MNFKNYTKVIAFILFLLSIAAESYAQTWKWVAGSGCYMNSMEAWLVAVDGHQNVYGVGYMFPGSTSSYFGTDTVLGRQDMLVSTDSNGNYRWEIGIPIPSAGGGQFTGIVADHDNVYAVGDFFLSMSFGGFSLTSSWNGCFCAKIDGAGHVVWLKKICDSGNISGCTIDKAGNLYMAGAMQIGQTTIGTTHLVNAGGSSGTSDALVVKMDTSGHVIWASRFGGAQDEVLNAIAVDRAGASYVAGTFASTPLTVGSSTLTGSFGASLGIVAKLSATGVPVWGNQVIGRDYLFMNAIAVDGADNVYLAGGNQGTVVFGSDSFTTLTTVLPYFLASYSGTGKFRWVSTMGPQFQQAWSVVTDDCYNVWIAGGIRMNALTDTMYIFRYDTSGNPLDSILAPTGGDDQVNMVVDNKGNMFVCGDSWTSYRIDTFMFGSDTLIAGDSSIESLFLAKLSYPTCPGMDKTEVRETTVHSALPRLYPNPANDECTIAAGEGTTLSKAEIYDMAGRLISTHLITGATATISVSGLTAGVYTCIITTADKSRYTHKLAVMR